VVIGVAWTRRRLVRGALARPTTEAERLALASLPFLAFCVMPFFYAETDGLVFNWSGYLTSNSIVFWIALSMGVRAVLFVRPERGRLANGVAVAIVVLFSMVSFGDVLTTAPARLAVAALLAGLGIAARRHVRTQQVASILTNAALLMAFRGSVVLDERVLLQLELLLAALRVSLLVGQALGRADEIGSLSVWLEAVALVVTAWSTLALTLHRLEWHVLYDFFAPSFVERHIGLFLPVIVGRYAIPLVLARRLLAEARPEWVTSSWRGAFGVAIAKVTTLVLVATGYALFNPTSDLFAQAVANVLTFSMPLLALAYEPRAEPARPSAAMTVQPQPREAP